MQRYANNVQSQIGIAVPNATVTVRVQNATPGTGALATIYSDDGITLVAGSALTTDAQGRFAFYAPDGKYDLTVTGTGITTYTLADVEIADVTETLSNDNKWNVKRLNDDIYPGTATGTVTNPTVGPTVAVDATSGGSMTNATRYYKIEYINWNGSTLASPSTALTPSTCGGGACIIRVTLPTSDNAWKTGAFAFRVLASSDNVNFFRQTGFPGELDTTGPLANSHYVPGDILLSSLTLSGTGPAASNTATIDADQVALNAMCDHASAVNQCAGTLRYNANSAFVSISSYTPAQLGTTPLVVAVSGAKLAGHSGGITFDFTAAGSTRKCNFAHTKIGCVMFMEISGGAQMDGLSIESASNGVMIVDMPATGHPAGSSGITIRNGALRTNGSLVVDGLQLVGVNYYHSILGTHISTSATGAGGAAVGFKQVSGGSLLFDLQGQRWTVRSDMHVFRNDTGFTDPDRGANQAGFPNGTGGIIRNLALQMTNAGGNKTPFKLTNAYFDLDGVTMADWNPAAGTPAALEFGCDSFCGTVGTMRIRNSVLGGDADVTSTLKFTANNGGSFQALVIENSAISASGSAALDMGGFNTFVSVSNDSQFACDPNVTGGKSVINEASSFNLVCLSPRTDTADYRMANLMVTGGTTVRNPSTLTEFFQCWWDASTSYSCYSQNGNTAANLWYRRRPSNRDWTFFKNGGSVTLFEVDSTFDSISVGRAASTTANTFLLGQEWSLGWRNEADSANLFITKDNSDNFSLPAGFLATPPAIGGTTPAAGAFTTLSATGVFTSTLATGTAPFTIASTTKVVNLNADLLDDLNSASASTASTVATRDSSGNLTAKAFIADAAGAGYTEFTTGALGVSTASTVRCGANTGNNFACSENGGAVQNVALVAKAQTFTANQTMGAHLLFTDNTFDIGASGATRPRTGYFATSVSAPTGSFSTAVVSPLHQAVAAMTVSAGDDGTHGSLLVVSGGNAAAGPGNGGNLELNGGGQVGGGTDGQVIINRRLGQGTAWKAASVTTGSISAGSSAAVTLTFSGVFTSAAWLPMCSVLEATTSTSTLRIHHIESITNTTNATAVVRIVNDDGGSAHTGTLYCYGVSA